MLFKEQDTAKLYYTMGEVAEMFDVKQSLIRFWEKEFDCIQPHKNKKGNRLFTAADIEILTRIYALVKLEGFTLEGAKQKLKQKPEKISGSGQQNEVILRLKEIRRQLVEIKNKM